LKWVLSGASEFDVTEAIAAAFPGEKAQPLIREVVTRLEKSGDFSTRVVIGWCFEATKDLYRRMVEIGDFPGALRAAKQLEELAKAKDAAAFDPFAMAKPPEPARRQTTKKKRKARKSNARSKGPLPGIEALARQPRKAPEPAHVAA